MKKEYAFLSKHLSRGVLRVWRANIDTASIVEVFIDDNAPDIESELSLYEAIRSDSILGLIHPDDVDAFLYFTSEDYLKSYFTDSSLIWALRLRIELDNLYKWIVLKILPYDDFSLENRSMIAFVELDDDVENMGTTPYVKRQYNVIASLAKNYMTLHLINLIEDTFYEFNITEYIAKLDQDKRSATERTRDIVCSVISKEHRDAALEFTDYSTMEERLKGKHSISQEFISVNVGWLRMRFTVAERTPDGKIVQLICTTENIDEEKKRLANLILTSNTDALTGLNNRHSFETIASEYRKNGVPEDLIVASIDANGLKTINDTFGHEAGDELLKGISQCIMSSMGLCGRLFRVGGDEFIAFLNVSTEEFEKVKSQFFGELESFKGVYVKGLSVAFGIASKDEFPSSNIDSLLKMADARMYQDKRDYYGRTGNVR